MVAGTAKVELYLAGVWTDITHYVRLADAIMIRRGRQDESSTPSFATAVMTLDDRDGRFSPRNAAGAWYGLIGRNTKLRVSVSNDAGTYMVRFAGEVPEWGPVAWDKSGRNVTIAVTAAGPRRRLTAVARPLGSAYRRAYQTISPLVGYWPMEDGSAATTFSSALSGGAPAGFSGTVTSAVDSPFVASAPLAELGDDAVVRFPVPTYVTSGSGQQVRMLVAVNASGAGVGWDLIIDTVAAHYFVVEYVPATNLIALGMFNYATGAQEYTTGGLPMGTEQPMTGGVRFSVDFKQNGTAIDTTLLWLSPSATGGLYYSQSIPASTFGRITAVRMANNGAGVSTLVGHLAVENHITSIFDLGMVISGYAGETASNRAILLAADEGVPLVGHAGTGTSALLGPRGRATFLDLFDEALYVDGGISTEAVDAFSLEYRTRSHMYSTSPAFTLTYGTSPALMGLEPIDDDQVIANDVTVTRINGGSTTAVAATGTLTPALVGDYPVEYPLNLYTDAQTQDQAGWRLALGTIDLPRWPAIAIDARLLTSSVDRDALIAVREGDRLNVSSPPSYSGGGGLIDVQVLGWVETITNTSWLFSFNARPYAPFDVGVYDETGPTASRYSSDGSALAAGYTSTATSFSVATPSGPLWTTDAAEFPLDIAVAGERITVTAISGAASPQTFTVTRSINSVVKAQASGAAVELYRPARYAL